ncbi:MAG: hypothetical protein KAJ81_07305, partial [Candidatus Latescibacteria bacterium]|nr:hypothetical protein [Candidatus Latescibacterota bacterium]
RCEMAKQSYISHLQKPKNGGTQVRSPRQSDFIIVIAKHKVPKQSHLWTASQVALLVIVLFCFAGGSGDWLPAPRTQRGKGVFPTWTSASSENERREPGAHAWLRGSLSLKYNSILFKSQAVFCRTRRF